MKRAIVLLLLSAGVAPAVEVLMWPGRHPCEIRVRITHPFWGTLGYVT